MRRAIVIFSVVVLLIGITLAAIGWFYSGQILGPDKLPGKTGQPVLALTDSTITLTSTPKARRTGHWAITWPGGYGKIGPYISVDDEQVVTPFQIAYGDPPDSTCRLAGFTPDANPQTWLGVDYEDVVIPARVGDLPAWYVPGADSTWAIFFHGRAATRAEVLRMLPGYMELGMPCLVVAYRNDRGAPKVGDGSYRLGMTEWEDLEDAVRYARDRGATGVVPVGCSMGGGIVAQFLRRSKEIALVRGAVLDAPALDWNALFAMQSERRGVPAFITDIGKFIASLRSGLEWGELNQLLHTKEFQTPMLIFHGDIDDTTPLEVSERFAAALPDLVTFYAVANAGHVESANLDPDWYGTTVSQWLRGRGVGHAN